MPALLFLLTSCTVCCADGNATWNYPAYTDEALWTRGNIALVEVIRLEGSPVTVTLAVRDAYGGRLGKEVTHPLERITLPGRNDPEATARVVLPGARFVLSPAQDASGLVIADPAPRSSPLPAALTEIAAARTAGTTAAHAALLTSQTDLVVMYALLRLSHSAGLVPPSLAPPHPPRVFFQLRADAAPALSYTPQIKSRLESVRNNKKNRLEIRIIAASVLAADPSRPQALREQFDWCLEQYASLPAGSEDRNQMGWHVRHFPGFASEGLRFIVARAEDRRQTAANRVDAVGLLGFPDARPLASWSAGDHLEAAVLHRLLDDTDPRVRLASVRAFGNCLRIGGADQGPDFARCRLVMNALVQLLQSRNPAIRMESAGHLARLGKMCALWRNLDLGRLAASALEATLERERDRERKRGLEDLLSGLTNPDNDRTPATIVFPR